MLHLNSSRIVSNQAITSTVKDFFILMKPRVMLLVIFTSITGLIIAPNPIHPFLAIVTVLCIGTGAGSAAAINMWYETDIDSIMARTKYRPTVTGRINTEETLAFGIILAFFSVLVMAICINYLSSILLLLSISFYVFIYTIWLKRKTIQNIVIGGAAGALPPVIGYSATTNNVNIESLILFSIVFFWTPPHFWSLALYCSEDYRKANIPMMPVIKGDRYTKYNILIYSILTITFVAIPYFISTAGILYLICSTILSIVFLYHAILLLCDKKNIFALKMFKYSIIYLFSIYLAMIFDYLIISHHSQTLP